MSEQPPTRVLLVDDHDLIRDGLAGVFALEPPCRWWGTPTWPPPWRCTTSCTPTSSSPISRCRTARDWTWSARCARTPSDTGVVVLTMHSGDEQIFAAMEAGASAFVGKDAPSTEVVEAARHAAVSPRSFLCASLTDAVLRRASAAATQMTSREHDVLKALADGLSAAEIGAGSTSASRPSSRTSPRSTRSSASPTGRKRWSPRCGWGCCPACNPRSDGRPPHRAPTTTLN